MNGQETEASGISPDQTIRAIALQAAAAFCKSSDAEDVIRVADRFEAFIVLGKVAPV